MARITQEFYCAKSGGGCGGYFLAKLNMSLNGVHKIICPNCGHDHQRRVNSGNIVEEKRFDSKPVDEIYATKASFRMEPYTLQTTARIKEGRERDSVVIDSKEMVQKDISHWIETFGDRI
jgi:hypothetical protein